uniref:Transmembrane protein n=1 Tax=Strongyloides papillosus TaxID=174720 RepID=A0A0N5B8B3_STREA
MDYLLNEYLFKYLPINFEESTKKYITEKAVNLVRLADWACKAQDYRKLYDNHASFLLAEGVFVVLSILTLVHAIRHGGRYIYTWIGIFIFSISSEVFRINYGSEWDYVFHAQSLLTLFGMRIPLHVAFGVMPTFVYSSYILAGRLKLVFPLEAVAAGLIHTLLYLPYSIVGTKLLWFQWHEWHPITNEKNSFNVPVAEYFIQSFSVISFLFILNLLRRIFLSSTFDWRLFVREFGIVLSAGLTAFGFTISTFYHSVYYLHFTYNISYFTIVSVYFAVLFTVIYSCDRTNSNGLSKIGNPFWFDEISASIIFIGFIFISLALVGDPFNTVSEGLHQPIGSCKEFGLFKGVKYQKFVCPINMEIKYFDFHCLPGQNPPQQQENNVPLEWYAICGTKYDNKNEFVFSVISIIVVSTIILYQFCALSGETEYDEFLIIHKFSPKPLRQTERQPSPVVSAESSFVKETKIASTRQSRCTPSYESQYLSRKKLQQADDDVTPKKAPGTVSMEKSRSRSRGLPISANRGVTRTITHSRSLKVTKNTVSNGTTSSISKSASSNASSPIGIGVKSLRSRHSNSRTHN